MPGQSSSCAPLKADSQKSQCFLRETAGSRLPTECLPQFSYFPSFLRLPEKHPLLTSVRSFDPGYYLCSSASKFESCKVLVLLWDSSDIHSQEIQYLSETENLNAGCKFTVIWEENDDLPACFYSLATVTKFTKIIFTVKSKSGVLLRVFLLMLMTVLDFQFQLHCCLCCALWFKIAYML